MNFIRLRSKIDQWRARRSPVSIELMQMRDAAPCAEIHAQAFAANWSESDFESFLLDRSVLAECLRQGRDRLIGFIVSRQALDEAEILTLAVRRKYRGAGLGSELARKHLGRLQNRGVKAIFLEVSEDNQTALKLYQSLGFRVIGARNNYYAQSDGSRKNALTMKLDCN